MPQNNAKQVSRREKAHILLLEMLFFCILAIACAVMGQTIALIILIGYCAGLAITRSIIVLYPRLKARVEVQMRGVK